MFFSVCLFFILKKEGISKFFCFIPIINLFYYFKICAIPTWTLFIPFINLIAFVISPYKILRLYGYDKVFCILSIMLPFVFIPHLAFSSKTKINLQDKGKTLKTVQDIELIEKKLEQKNNFLDELYQNDYNLGYIPLNENSYENKIEKIEKNLNSEANSVIEEFDDFTSLMITSQTNDVSPDNSIKSIIELEDDTSSYVTTGMVDMVNNSIIEKANIKMVDNSNYKEYENEQTKIESIAFGGEQKINDRVHAKVEELKCDRCGSSLVGANGYCPGCGKKI